MVTRLWLALLALLVLAVGATALTGGPDGYGYVFIDSNEPTGPTFTWDSILGDAGTTTLIMSEEQLVAVPIGFAFEFYGDTHTTAYVSDNGFVMFDSCCNSFFASSIPDSFSPNNFVAGYQSDILPSCGGTYAYQTSGTSPDMVFTVEYNGVLDWSTCTYSTTMQIKLFENGCAQVVMQNADGNMGGYPSLIGIEDQTGSDGLEYEYAATAASYSDTTIQFCADAPPEAGDDTASSHEDGPTLSINVLQNDVDPEGQPLDIVAVTAGVQGTTSIKGPPGAEYIQYVPLPNKNSYYGPDTFQYQVQDPAGLTAIGTVSVTLSPVNDAPSMALGPPINVLEDAALTTKSLYAAPIAAGPTGDELTTQSVTLDVTVPDPSFFSVLPQFDVTGMLTFQPAPHRVGQQVITVVPKDDGGTANGGVDVGLAKTFSIQVAAVNDPPVYIGTTIFVEEDHEGYEDAPFAGTVLPGPPTALDEADQMVSIAFGGADPALFLQPPTFDGEVLRFRFKPDVCGIAVPLSFGAKDDGGGQDTTPFTQFVEATCVADPPTALDDGPVQVPANSIDTPLGVLQNDLTYPDDVWPGGDFVVAAGYSDVLIGSASLADDALDVLYTPPPSWTGETALTYTARDIDGLEDSATVFIDVFCPTLTAKADSYVTAEDQGLTLAAYWGLLANDINVDDRPLTAHLVTGPATGQVVVAEDGGFSYVPAQDFFGTDSFTYEVRDDTYCTDRSKVTITITPQNDPPTAGDDHFTIAENADIVLAVFANDGAMPDAPEPITFVAAQGAFGKLTQSSVPPGLRYQAVPGWSGVDVFTYTIADPHMATATATVVVVVEGTNDAPVAVADHYVMRPERSNRVGPGLGVLANDSDQEGDPLVAELVTGPKHGTLQLAQDGSFLYRPGGYRGPDSFSYVAKDAAGPSSIALVHLDVLDPKPPIAAFAAAPRFAAEVPIRFYDLSSDPDGSIVAWSWRIGEIESFEANPLLKLAPGRYVVDLLVVDDEGLTDSSRQVVEAVADYIRDEGGSHAGSRPTVAVGPDQVVFAGDLVVLAADAEAIAFHWSGPADLTLHNANRPTATFLAPAVDEVTPFPFTVVVFDGHRESLPARVNVTVIPSPGEPAADAGADLQVVAGGFVERHARAFGFRDPVEFVWSLEEGEVEFSSDNGTLRFIAPQPGRLLFTLTARGGDDEARAQFAVEVTKSVAQDPIEVTRLRAREPVLAFETSREGDVTWHFGDGTTSRLPAPIHRYEEPGRYQVVLEVLTADGRLERHSQLVEVHGLANEAEAPGLPLLLLVAILGGLVARRRR